MSTPSVSPLHSLGNYLELLQQHQLLTSTFNSSPFTLDSQREQTISNITFDSRAVTPGTLFVCKGVKFSPQFLLDAQANGAIAYVSETVYPQATIPALIVSDIRLSMALLGHLFYNRVARELQTVAITGTKGKSTTTYFLRSILDKWFNHLASLDSTYPARTGFISTIATYDGVIDAESHLTTPEALQLFQHFQNAKNSGLTHMVLEVSSQALKYKRVVDMEFNIGCFLNIGVDHISENEHPDFADYFQSKLELFSQCQTVCLNSGTQYFAEILQAAKTHAAKIVCFGTLPTDEVRLTQLTPTDTGLRFHITSRAYNGDFNIPLAGTFNAENALAAIAICQELGVPEEFVRSGLACAQVSGRMMLYSTADKAVTVVVDYAHNSMSFQAVLASLQTTYPKAKLVTVFGAPGGKAPGRRKEMAEVVNQYCQYAVVTDEDRFAEEFADIAAEISAHLTIPHNVIQDRGAALQRAFQELEEQLVILLAGKGEEEYLVVDGKYVPGPSDVTRALTVIAQYEQTKAEQLS